MNTISKFDIRISTKPIIKGEHFFYKIWIIRKGTHKKAHIKKYYPIELLDKKSKLSSLSSLTLSEILSRIKLNADVEDDFEEYCQMHFQDPSDPICRSDYLDDLERAERFKKFITQEQIRSFPFMIEGNDEQKEEEINKIIGINGESSLKLLGYSIVFLHDKKEYDKLAALQSTVQYYAKIVESYGFDTYTGDFNAKVFPITKEDKQMKNIAEDFKKYFQALSEYDDYLKELIKKYNIKQTGNTLKRVAFNLKNYENDNMPKYDSKYIKTLLDYKFFS